MADLARFDLRLLAEAPALCGVDEAGRGALAGPVVAGAVLLGREFYESRWRKKNGARIQDSKALTAAEREELRNELEQLPRETLAGVATGAAEVDEIAALNILGATKLAMRRALEALEKSTGTTLARTAGADLLFGPVDEAMRPLLLVDGTPLSSFPFSHRALVSGDARSLAIAMASIFAKTERDRRMVALAGCFPGYGLDGHKGYGTEEHREAILRLGPSPQHRPLFIRKLLEGKNHPGQSTFNF